MAKVSIPYFVWRDGRPRWVPGPRLRALGYKGRDLKHDDGRWLDFGAATNEARRINSAIEKAGADAPAAVLPACDRSFGQMIDEFLNRPKIKLDDAKTKAAAADMPKALKPLSRSQRLAYHAHGRIGKAWMGDAPAAAITPAMMEAFYADRLEDMSVRSANAIMSGFRAFFYFGEKKLRWPIKNPVSGLELEPEAGRLVIWTREEIDCYAAFADALGWPSLADAMYLGLLTSQRRNDLLPLKGGALDGGDIYRFLQSKTGREAKVKAVPTLLDRVRALRARKLERWGESKTPDVEIICEATGAPYPADGNYFGRRFRAMKLIAAGGNGDNADIEEAYQLLGVTSVQVAAINLKPMPSLLGKWFRDLRDTAVTWLAAAGCDRYEISTVTGLSLASVDAILDKHYFVRDDAFAISAGDKLAAYLGRIA